MSKHNWDNYLSTHVRARDYPNVYSVNGNFGDRVRRFFIRASETLERPFHWRRSNSSFSSFKSSSSSFSSSTHEHIDLSGISADETFVIGGHAPSKFSRFWRKFKALFRDDSPRIQYNARHQFPIRGARPSAAEMARQRKRELRDSVDLSEIAQTLERGKLR